MRSAPCPPVVFITVSAKSAARVHKPTSSPARPSSANLSFDPEVPMTIAPSIFPICSEATPTPDDTPLIKSHSPALRRPCSTSMSYDTRKVIGMPAACSQDRVGGTAMASACSIRAYSENAPAHRPMTRSPALKAVTPSPTATTSPAPSPPMAFHVPALPCRPWPTTNSPRLSAAACMRTRSWFDAGCGTGVSRNSSTVSASVISIHQDCIEDCMSRY